ncbi:MAG TPA: hypothetical protein VHN77_02940 [Phycisphaerales bacterium]|nr:hypothetical protein [Phycisphaerales bacterium]
MVDAGYNAEGITPKQEAAIVALLNEPTVARAAITADVDERTLHRWLADPDFARAYRNARRVAFAQAIAVTQRYAPLAIHTLGKIMADQTVGASARVSAATALLKFSRESIELDDLASRVDELERSLGSKDGVGNAYTRALRNGTLNDRAGEDGL